MNLLMICMAIGLLATQAGEAGSGADADATFQLEEHSPRGTIVGTVADPAAGARYELVEQDVRGTFALDSATGRIDVADPAALDFEQRSAFTLTVRVTTPQENDDPLWKSFAERLDGEGFDGPASTETVVERRVRVRLLDVNEPPSIQDQSFDAAGASADDFSIGIVAADDPDAGDRLSFALEEGADAGAFLLDADSGQLTFAPEARARFDGGSAALRVRVTDRGGLAGTAAITVALPVRAVQPVAVTPDEGPVEAPRPVPRVPAGDPIPLAGGGPTPPPSDKDPEVAPAATGATHSTAAPRPASPAWWRFWDVKRGVSPVAVLLAGLLGLAAHVIRVRTLRRRLRALSARPAGDPCDPAVDSSALEAAFLELEQQRQALTEVCASLADDRARLTDERRQLELDREELAARQEELTGAEALLVEQRAELDGERRGLEAQWAELTQARDYSRPLISDDRREDLYAVDEEGDLLPGEHARESTWGDSPLAAGTDPDLATLRANLADMLSTGSAGPGGEEAPGSPPRTDHMQRSTALPLADPTSLGGSRDSLYRRSPEPASEDHAAPADSDSITTYMEALLKRLRQNGGTGSPEATASAPPASTAAPAAARADEWTAHTEGVAAAAQPVIAPAAPAVPAGSEEPRPQPAPRPRQNKTEVRDKVNSLREVANLSARSAVARHVRRIRSKRGLLVGVSSVVLLAVATALVARLRGGPGAGIAQAWVLLGAGAVVLVHYVWSICLADRRYTHRALHVARKPVAEKTERDVDRTVVMTEPDRGAASRRPAAATTQGQRPRTAPAPAEESYQDETCTAAGR